MNDEPPKTIEREVKGWPRATTGDAGRGGLRFIYARVELGHLHGSSLADLPFPQKCATSSWHNTSAAVNRPNTNMRPRLSRPEPPAGAVLRAGRGLDLMLRGRSRDGVALRDDNGPALPRADEKRGK
jgi:hypothetical protein